MPLQKIIKAAYRSLLASCFITSIPLSGMAQYSSVPPASSLPILNMAGATLDQIADSMYAHTDSTDTAEGGELERARLFRAMWQGRVTANDSSGRDMFSQYYSALRTAVLSRSSGCGASTGFNGNWSIAGPDNLAVQASGYTNGIWVDPTDSTFLLAGSINSSLFRSTDAGAHWECITDNANIAGTLMGISNIAVNPYNRNHIYLGTANAGILKTIDGGATWQQEFIWAATN